MWWRESGLFRTQAAPQVQSMFSVSCVSRVTVSRLVQAFGHGFVILRHLSATPVELAGLRWEQEAPGVAGLKAGCPSSDPVHALGALGTLRY